MTPEESLRYAWTLFKAEDGIIEVRALDCTGRSAAFSGWSAGTVSGYFDDEDAFVQAVLRLDATARASGIYVTLNPVLPDLLARAANRLVAAKRNETTHDDEIVRRRWLLVDFDPIRPAGISSTTAELKASMAVAQTARAALSARGWPDPVQAMSGNGVHLLYPVEMANDAGGERMTQAMLRALAVEFGTETVDVDTINCNASRVVKLSGTVARKGDPTQRRPHRRAQFLETLVCPKP